MGLTPLAPGTLATIVTVMEMTERPRLQPMPPSVLRLVRWSEPRPDIYRGLFRRVGEPWLWVSRLVMDDDALTAIIHDPAVMIWAVVDRRGIEIGILELDFRVPGECEIAFFGLVKELASQGHGSWLMAQTMMLAWRKDVTRVWLHTCTFDAPSAYGFYQKHGFTACSQAIETFDDPRLTGLIRADAASHIPLLGEVAIG